MICIAHPWKAFWMLVAAGFVPVPLKVFTWASGIVGMPLLPFIGGMVIGRGKRVFIVAGVIRLGGPKAEAALHRWIEPIGWAILVLIVGTGHLLQVHSLNYCDEWGFSETLCVGLRGARWGFPDARRQGRRRSRITASMPARRGRARVRRRREARAAPGGTYRVQRGDTLYSIAFRHGVDYRDLAEWNGIPPPYTIYPGRELRLSPARAATKPPVAQAAPPPKPAAPPPARSRHAAEARAVRAGRSRSPPSTNAGTPSHVGSPTRHRLPVAPPPPSPCRRRTAASGDIAWRWPADGQVVGGYVARRSDAAGHRHRRQGRRAGAGRRGRHGRLQRQWPDRLRRVDHRQAQPRVPLGVRPQPKRLVQEGDSVKAGQTIAEMGSSGASSRRAAFRDPPERQAVQSARLSAAPLTLHMRDTTPRHRRRKLVAMSAPTSEPGSSEPTISTISSMRSSRRTKRRARRRASISAKSA